MSEPRKEDILSLNRKQGQEVQTMTTVAITGASGNMGSETLRQLCESDRNYKIKILLLDTFGERQFARRVKKLYKSDVEVIFGDITDKEACKKLVEGADYVLHMAAIIPPKSDRDAHLTRKVNYGGTVNMVDAVKEMARKGKEAKFVYVSTVALYGHRNYLHPWGRVGDPLLPSVFDVYAASKLKAERYVLESGLQNWGIVRQTGILYDKLLLKNISDGLMFHTGWNVPLEWVTAEDSGRLMKNIVEFDLENKAEKFWKRCFDIGGGKENRQTGFETFNDGFGLIGGSAEKFMEPNWNMSRNFHGVWFADGNELNDIFDYVRQDIKGFWADLRKKHKIYRLAKVFPTKFIKKLVFGRLLKDENSPVFWIDKEENAKVKACFGSRQNIEACPSDWKDYPLLSKNQITDVKAEYEEMKEERIAKVKGYLLDHGYDETKPDSELGIEDMRKAAEFRGGKCLSENMVKGDLYTKLEWACCDGHRFFASPYTVLKAGHWCETCCEPDPVWRYDVLAKKIPFFAQVWFDTHAINENTFYEIYPDSSTGCRKIKEATV